MRKNKRNYISLILYLSILIGLSSCGMPEISKLEPPVPPEPFSASSHFALSATYTDEAEPEVTFNADIEGNSELIGCNLWVEEDGVWTLKGKTSYNNYGSKNLFQNPGFDSFFEGIASYWGLWESQDSLAEASSDIGVMGEAQKIDVIDPSQWGVSFFQDIKLIKTRTYEWSFWYKTSGDAPIYADVVYQELGYFLDGDELKGTNGEWKYKSLIFYVEDADQNILRIVSADAHTVWIDEQSVKLVKNMSKKKFIQPKFKVKLYKGKIRWFVEAIHKGGEIIKSPVQTVDTTY